MIYHEGSDLEVYIGLIVGFGAIVFWLYEKWYFKYKHNVDDWKTALEEE
jgi:hypothetical protein